MVQFDRRIGPAVQFDRAELDEMVQRWVDENKRCEIARRLEAAGRDVHRGRHVRLELRAQGRLHGRRPGRDPRPGARPGNGRARGLGLPVPAVRHRRPQRRRHRILEAGVRRTRDDGTHYQVAGIGGSWFRYGGNFQWSWQRDFFDFGNVSSLFLEMITNNAMSDGMNAADPSARRPVGCRGGTGRQGPGPAVVSTVKVPSSFADLSREDLAILVPELLLCGHLIDRSGMPHLIGAFGREGMTAGRDRGVDGVEPRLHAADATRPRIRGRRRRDDLQGSATRHRCAAPVHGLPVPRHRSRSRRVLAAITAAR